jgi:hypothetical protein
MNEETGYEPDFKTLAKMGLIEFVNDNDEGDVLFFKFKRLPTTYKEMYALMWYVNACNPDEFWEEPSGSGIYRVWWD